MGNKSFNSYTAYHGWGTVDGGLNPPTLVGDTQLSTIFNRGGLNNPYWKTQVRAMNNATTPMTVSFAKVTVDAPRCRKDYTVYEPPSWFPRRTWDESVGLYNYMNRTPFSFHTNFFWYGVDTDELAENRAISKLYRCLQNAHHQFQGGVFVGEIRKTAEMIAGAAKKLKHGVLDYLGKALVLTKKPGGRGRPLNNLYLESVFGWQPLVYDVRDGAKAIGRLIHENVPVRFRAFGFAEAHLPLTGTGVHTGSPGGTFLTSSENRTESRAIYYGAFKGTVEEDRIDYSAQRVVSMAGFDLRSFIPTVWELVPYSFLIDYFVNVGELLEAMCTDTNSVQWLGHVLRRDTLETDRFEYCSPIGAEKESLAPGLPNAAFTGKSGSVVRKYVTISRGPAVVPFLMPRFKLSEISGKHFLNIAALLTR